MTDGKECSLAVKAAVHPSWTLSVKSEQGEGVIEECGLSSNYPWKFHVFLKCYKDASAQCLLWNRPP